MSHVCTRIDSDERTTIAQAAADILGVDADRLIITRWDETFPNTGGPSRDAGVVVGRAFTGFEVMGFEGTSTMRKIKCCVFPHQPQKNVWDEWSGTPGDHAWSKEAFDWETRSMPKPPYTRPGRLR